MPFYLKFLISNSKIVQYYKTVLIWSYLPLIPVQGLLKLRLFFITESNLTILFTQKVGLHLNVAQIKCEFPSIVAMQMLGVGLGD